MGTVVTACTKKKAGDAYVFASSLSAGVTRVVGRQWIAALNNPAGRIRAANLYQGGSHAESRRAANDASCPHFIVSAGLGLISADTEVPNYAASVLSGGDNILAKLRDGASSGDWWQWLQQHSPFAKPLETVISMAEGPCLIALPQAYLVMIEAELLALPEGLLERVRLFSGARAPETLAHLQMPYDDRLDGGDSPYKGTRSNFAPRALRHFVNAILRGRETDSAAHHAMAVEAALADWTRPSRTLGKRKTDAELRAILKANWAAMGGRSTRMLRLLRDDLGIACEQGRFAGLVRDLRAEQGSTR